MGRIILSISLLVFCVNSYGNDLATIDSLKAELEVEKSVNIRAELMYQIGDMYYGFQRDSCIYYLTASLFISKSIDDKVFQSKTASVLGMAYQVIDPVKSAEYLFEALELAEKAEDDFLISYNYNVIGTHYRVLGELDLAEEYYNKSIDLKVTLKDSVGISFCYNNLGIVYMLKAEYDIGLEYWMKSVDMKLLTNDKVGASTTMSNIGIYYKDIGRTFEALQYFKSGLAIELEENLLDRAAHSYLYLGDLYVTTENWNAAIKSYEESILLMDSVGLIFDKRDPLFGMSVAYENAGNYKKAYDVITDYVELNSEFQDSAKSKTTKELGAKYESEKKEKENLLLKSENDAKDARIKEEEAKTALKEANNFYLTIGLVVIGVVMIFIILALRRVREAKKIIEEQKHLVDEKNTEITDSISYAKRLQDAILPTTEVISSSLSENFVLYTPKDIVAGDFYWLEKVGDKVLFAAADCTGHGVPGALVSVVCHNALNRAVREFSLIKPSQILDKVTDLVIETFEKSTEEVKDGMDIALCSFDMKTKEVQYAGANNSLYYIRDGAFNEIKPTKQPVGKYDNRKDFENHILKVEIGDVFYLFTDGYPDQFGGEKGKKFKYKPFKELLAEIALEPMSIQKEKLNTSFNDWKGEYVQVDDVCVIGVRI